MGKQTDGRTYRRMDGRTKRRGTYGDRPFYSDGMTQCAYVYNSIDLVDFLIFAFKGCS